MAEIEGLVRDLREGDDAAKTAAARTLRDLAWDNDANEVLIAEAGGIAPLVELVHDGSAEAKVQAAQALRNLAFNDANKVLIAEAGGIPPLVKLLRNGSADLNFAAWVLGNFARDNAANAVAIAAAVGFDAVVELARRGSVTVDDRSVVEHAGVPAKRKAARILLRKCLPRAIPDEIAAATAAFL